MGGSYRVKKSLNIDTDIIDHCVRHHADKYLEESAKSVAWSEQALRKWLAVQWCPRPRSSLEGYLCWLCHPYSCMRGVIEWLAQKDDDASEPPGHKGFDE